MPEFSDSAQTYKSETQWYRQFWPWFLIILPGTVVIASLVTVYIAFKGADALVVKDYYKEGLAINKTVDDLRNAKDMHLNATLSFTGNKLDLKLRADSEINDNELLLSFEHPFDDKQDVNLTLKKSSSNEFVSELPSLAKGKWYIALQSTSTSEPWRLLTTVYLPQSEVIIRPE